MPGSSCVSTPRPSPQLSHDVVVLHTAGIRSDCGTLWTIEEETDPELTEGIPTYRVAHRRMPLRTSYVLYLLSALDAIRRVRAGDFRPDVIHVHTYGPGIPAVLGGTIFRLPVVITEQFSGFPRRAMSKREVAKARFAFRRAARVLPVCEHLKRAILAYGIRANFEVVPNTVDTEVFFPSEVPRNEVRPTRLMFVGNLEPTHLKGFPTLVEALRLLRHSHKDYRVDVVGDGPERSNYERAVSRAGLSELVVFHGQKPKSDVAEMMRAADAFVLPSRYDNMPCAVLEAMASGLPVISTRVGGIPEIVDKRSGILVLPEDAAELAAALDRILSGLVRLDSMEIAASARSRYGLRAVGEQLDRVYRSVLDQTRRPHGLGRFVPARIRAPNS